MQDLEYLGGGSALPVGTYDVVISNPTYTKAMNATGWTVTNSDNGNIAGTIALVSTPSNQHCLYLLIPCSAQGYPMSK